MPGAMLRMLAAAAAIAAAAGAAVAAQPVDPEWPCVQRKVPELAIGQMWAGPLPDEGWRQDAAVRELARSLVPRPHGSRLPLRLGLRGSRGLRGGGRLAAVCGLHGPEIGRRSPEARFGIAPLPSAP